MTDPWNDEVQPRSRRVTLASCAMRDLRRCGEFRRCRRKSVGDAGDVADGRFRTGRSRVTARRRRASPPTPSILVAAAATAAFLLVSTTVVFRQAERTLFADGSALTFNAETRAYENFLVEITDDVADADGVTCEELINSLQVMIIQGSSALNKATRGLASIGTAVIKIPKRLAAKCPAEEAAGWNASTWEASHGWRADLRVSARGRDSVLTTPHTIQHRGCGRPGLQMHLNAELVAGLETSIACNGGRMFLSEFAKYRYGVFDEHGFIGDQAHPLAYISSSGNIEPSSCSNVGFPGGFADPHACVYNVTSASCLWVFNGDTYNITSSLMSHQYLDRVAYFCDDDTHVSDAPTKHNLLCYERSVWDVIQSHADFAGMDAKEMNGRRRRGVGLMEYIVPTAISITVAPDDVERRPIFLIANKWMFASPGASGPFKLPPNAWKARCRSLFHPIYFLSSSTTATGRASAASTATRSNRRSRDDDEDEDKAADVPAAAAIAGLVYSQGGGTQLFPRATVGQMFDALGDGEFVPETSATLCTSRYPNAHPAETGQSVNLDQVFRALNQQGELLSSGAPIVLIHGVDYDFPDIDTVVKDWVEAYKLPVYQVVDGPRLSGNQEEDPQETERRLRFLENVKALSKYGSFVTFESDNDDVGLTQARFSEALTTGVLPFIAPDIAPILVYSSLASNQELTCGPREAQFTFTLNYPLRDAGNVMEFAATFMGLSDEMIVAAGAGTMEIALSLLTPSSAEYEATNGDYYGSGTYLARFSVGNKADMGQWKVKTKCAGTSQVPLYLSVYMFRRSSVTNEGTRSRPPAIAESLAATPLLESHGRDDYFLPYETDFNADAKISENKNNKVAADRSPPLLQLRVENGPRSGIPVTGLDVSAIVTKPDGETVEVDLHDSGLGMYDITAHDGIYSNFLEDFHQQGYYSVQYAVRPGDPTMKTTRRTGGSQHQVSQESGLSAFQFLGGNHRHDEHLGFFFNRAVGDRTIPHQNAVVEDLCCGGRYPAHATAQVPDTGIPWVRYVTGPTFVLTREADAAALNFAPSRVTDLNYDFHEDWGTNGNKGIWIRWTMPEDVFVLANGTFGNLDLFDLRYSDTRTKLQDFFAAAPKVECNGQESFNDLYYCHCMTYEVPASSFVAVRPKRKDDDVSSPDPPLSNIVRIFVPAEVPVVTTPPPGGESDDSRLGDVRNELRTAYVVLGSLCGILLLVSAVLAGLLWRTRRQLRSRNWFRSGLTGHNMEMADSSVSVDATGNDGVEGSRIRAARKAEATASKSFPKDQDEARFDRHLRSPNNNNNNNNRYNEGPESAYSTSSSGSSRRDPQQSAAARGRQHGGQIPGQRNAAKAAGTSPKQQRRPAGEDEFEEDPAMLRRRAMENAHRLAQLRPRTPPVATARRPAGSSYSSGYSNDGFDDDADLKNVRALPVMLTAASSVDDMSANEDFI